jgi:hypothetical protein
LFAALAMQALITANVHQKAAYQSNDSAIADSAYSQANEMLRARNDRREAKKG